MAVFVWLLHNTAKEIGERKGCPLPWPTATLALLDKSGGCGTRLLTSFRLRQSSPKTPDSSSLLGMAAGDFKPANHHRHCEQDEESSFW